MKEKVQRLMEAQQVKAVMAQLDRDEKRMVDDQIELCAINSPSNQEEKRAKRYEEMFRELPFDKVWMDEVWNVYGLLKGTGGGPKIVISAHMDTVFDADTDVTPRIDENGVIHAPGITDDTRGMAEVLGIARAMMETGVRAMGDILFCGTVGEEGLGNLRGTRHMFETMDDIDGFISIDGPMPEKITLHAIASMVYHVTYRGVGGHALGMFGIPNANNAMGRAIAKISDLQVPKKPVTVFNVGIARGGTSTNGIPTKSELMIDMRSMQDAELDRLADRIAACCREACEEENARWNHPTETVTVEIEASGRRPGGEQDMDAPHIQAALAAYRAFGMEPVIPEGGSTDSNIPISKGIPSCTIGRGGKMGLSHTVNEYFDPTGSAEGPKRDLVLLLAFAGLEGVCEPVVQKKNRG